MAEKSLSCPVRYLKGIGPKRADELKKIGVESVEDLFYFFPRRYLDRTNLEKIGDLKDDGQVHTVQGRILAKHFRRSFKKRSFGILEVVIGDDTGKLVCVWFNQPYLQDYFQLGQDLILYGKLDYYAGRLQMNSPEFEIISSDLDSSIEVERILPVYSLPPHFSQRIMRRIIKSALEEYLPYTKDFLPYDVRVRNNLLNLAKSLKNIHFPESFVLQKEAYRRLCFDEFFLFQLPLVLRKLAKKEKLGIAHNVNGPLLKAFLQNLPFSLTPAQRLALEEILLDMSKPTAMQRLLQGDVGSGKTVVATCAAVAAVESGYQVAFMVPTEILARQHYQKIQSWFEKLMSKEAGLSLGLLTGSFNPEQRKDILKKIQQGQVNFIIGTHSLLESEVAFKNLGLVIIDEQHKFGVSQRALLPEKGINPDILVMTATPIPRTLAITIYGDLDISVINELPPGRKRIVTLWLKREQRDKAYDIAQEQLLQGSQVYIIYPVIEGSFALDIEGAEKMFWELRETKFKNFNLGLIHGRLAPKKQEKIMQDFQDKKLDVLVATTVLEVGIDVPNATCMIIENAERFGLAQLHQLRGRIGRGEKESFCILISDGSTAEAKARLAAMVRHSDGFRIAEQDLKIRGPGEFFGQRQHGLSELKLGNPLLQMQLLREARQEAIRLISKDRRLSLSEHALLAAKLLQRFPNYERILSAG